MQLRRVKRALLSQPGPAILMGDLDLEPPLASRVTRLQALATQPTFPMEEPTRQIDHILGREVVTQDVGEAVQLAVSDHRALVADLHLAE